MSMTKSFTWEELVELEPQLIHLFNAASNADTDEEEAFCSVVAFHEIGGYKDQVMSLVGWTARSKHELLNTSEAYDVAFHKIRDALPPCRNCNCVG